MDLFSQNKSEKAVLFDLQGGKERRTICPDTDEIGIKPLKGDGNFWSKECIELLKEADIVVTNPSFSLFQEYVT